MIFGALRVLNGLPKGGQPASEVKPTDVHKPVAWIIFLVTALIIVVMLATNHLNNGLMIACIIGFPVLIFGSLFVKGVSEVSVNQKRLDTLPTLKPPDTAKALRARADRLALSQKSCAPASVQDVLPEARVVKPARITTLRELQADRELTERMMRAARIIIAECPACGAEEASLCTFVEGEYVTVLDAERGIIAHNKRVGNAIKTHKAKVTEVVAQFDGHVPEDVWEAAI